MTLGAFTIWAVDHATALVNLYRDRGEAVTRHDLQELVRNYGFSEDEVDVADFAWLADDLREVFVHPSRATRVERLNALLDRYQPTPRIVQHDSQEPHFHYVTTGPPVDHVGSSFVMAIANAVVDQGAERFGWCAAPHCQKLFFDRSRNRSQRFCSRSCATRVHVRAYRARQ